MSRANSNTSNKKAIGDKGEQIAAQFLIDKGYKLLEKNWRYKHGEIDLIVENNNTIIFVEVKTRSTSYFGNPEIAVTPKKQKTIANTAQAYLDLNNLNKECRFDIISIVLVNEHVKELFHIEDAFFVTNF